MIDIYFNGVEYHGCDYITSSTVLGVGVLFLVVFASIFT